MERSVICK